MVAEAHAGAPDANEQKRRLRQEIAIRLHLDSPATADDDQFWREVGLRHQMADPKATPAQLAILVLRKLGAGEDEVADFAEEGGGVNVAAHEWLLAYLTDATERAETGEEGDDDDDGNLAREQQILVANVDNPIQSIVQFIQDGTIVLDPDWQRGYVWKQRQKRRFIESIFLKLPIPPVLLFQDQETGKMFVIDGRQRLETVYRYRKGSKERKESFRTYGSKQPGWGPDDKLGPYANKHFDKLPEEMQRHFNTFVIPARVFYNLPRRTLYEVFRRYNTGSEKLRPAEIRKAVYQGAPLHEMMFELAGETGVESVKDSREREVARVLEDTMRGKKARYGAYNFVGRCLAFANLQDEMSVANAINKFMDDFAKDDPARFRAEFVEAIETTLDWYAQFHPLCTTDSEGKRILFHEWVATIQVVSTMHALRKIKAGELTVDQARQAIESGWTSFVYGTWNDQAKAYVGGVLQEKQNTTTHWQKHRDWIAAVTGQKPTVTATA